MKNITDKILQKVFTVQGVSIDTISKEYGRIPIFNISSRRIVTNQFSNIIEHKNITEDFDMLTVNENMYPGTPSVIVFEIGVVTDLWYGYKNIRLSNIGFLILHHTETFEQIIWESDGNKYKPIIQTDSRTISPDTL